MHESCMSTDLYALHQDVQNGKQDSLSRVRKEDREREKDIKKATDELKAGSITVEKFLQKKFGPPVKTALPTVRK